MPLRPVLAFWNHINSVDYNPKLDQIMLSVRGCNEIWLLDHSTTTQEADGHIGGRHGKGGDLIYRWGNPAAYKCGTARDKQLVHQHGAEGIPDGHPSAGHITIFNNVYDRGWSCIEEIVPPMDASGRYILAPGKPYGPEKPVWHYETKNRTDFFSSEISGAHRLPNGNTFICSDTEGHFFEVTVAGELAWEYINPVTREGALKVLPKCLPMTNSVFRAFRHAADHPALKGRDLTPKGTITERAAQGLDARPDERRPADRPARDRPQAGDGKRQEPKRNPDTAGPRQPWVKVQGPQLQEGRPMRERITRREVLALTGGAAAFICSRLFAAAGGANLRRPNFVFVLGEPSG